MQTLKLFKNTINQNVKNTKYQKSCKKLTKIDQEVREEKRKQKQF